MDRKQVAKATTKVISSYLTYQAVQTVVAQLTETNPPVAIWLREFSGRSIVQDGEWTIYQRWYFTTLSIKTHSIASSS
jgi:hypothetical protein